MSNLRILMMLLALALASACNFGPGPGGDDDDAADDDDTAGNDPVDATIAEINAGDITVGASVIVRGVITTPFTSDDDDNEARFWIQDGSGPGTGLLVFTFPDVVEALDDADLWAGDEVEITGIYDRPFEFNELRVTAAADVELLGQGELPEPHPVAAEDIEGGFAAADLEGVIVELTDVTADNAGGWDNYWEWEADGAIIDSLYYYVDVAAGYTVDRIAGVLFTDFGNAVVAPRWAWDADFTHPGCDTAADGDLQDINCGGVAEDDDVDVSGLIVVSGAPWYGDAFYAVDGTGELFGGINIFSFNDLTPPPIGAVINVVGEYEEYRGQSEILAFDPEEDIEDTGDTADVIPFDLADACEIGEGHEGLLVTLASVTVTQDSDGAQFGYYEVEGCPLIQVASEFWDDQDAFGDDTGGEGEIVNLVGVVVDELDIYSINPRSTDDWDSWGE